MDENKAPQTLEEAYGLRDAARVPEERVLYQEHVYRLRRERYESRGVRMDLSRQKRARGRENGAGGARARGRQEESEREGTTRQATILALALVGLVALIAVLLWAANSP